ncbi:hypothetical protein HDU91_002850, partial [Kappamyces sp. JEL0680]
AFDSQGLALGSPIVIPDTSLQTVVPKSLQFTPKVEAPSSATFEIRAFDPSSQIVYRSKRTYSFVPPPLQLSPDKPTLADLANGAYVLVQDGKNSPPGNGWTRRNGALTLGDGTQYANNVYSAVYLYCAAPNAPSRPLTVSFTVHATYDTEEDTDFLYVGVQDAKGTLQLYNANHDGFQGYSGNGVLNQTYTFSLTQGPAFQLYFLFTSDTGFSATGVAITSIAISLV